MRALFTVLIVMMAAGRSARANEGYFYMKDNTKLFEVVVESAKDEVEEAPGVYFLDDRTGKGKALVHGNVLNANRVFPGILAYGPLNSQRASAHDALAVIDNELVVFNRFSDPKKANTSIVIGDAVRGVPVVDVVTGLPIRLPPITDYNDIVIRKDQHLAETQGLPSGGHFMMISLRAPSFVGDGLTFAFVLEPGRPGVRPRIYGDRAMLISHSFLTRESLDRLVVPNTPYPVNQPPRDVPKLHLYSPIIIAKFKTQIARKSNSPVVTAWLEHLERFENYVAKGLAGGKSEIPAHQLSLGIPRYDMLNPREVLPMSPVETIAEDPPSVFGQVFNHVSSDFGIIQADSDQFSSVPIGRNGSMRFIATDAAGFRQIAHLPIDRDFKTGRHSFFPQSEDNVAAVGARSFLLFSNKSAFLMSRPVDSPKASYQMLAIKNPVLSPEDKIEFIRRPFRVNNHPGSVLIIHRRRTSFTENRGRREERVEVSAVTIDEHEGMSIVGHQVLYDGTAPLTFEEMKLRIVAENGDILFDRVSPVRGAKRYARDEQELDEDGEIASYQRFRTTPYEAISHEGGKPAKQRWLRHLLRHTVLQDVLTYREYNETGAREGEQATGFYLEPPPNDEPARRSGETYLRGIPLNNYTAKLTDYPSYVLVQKTLYQPFGNTRNTPSVNATIVPFDSKGEPRAMKLLEGRKPKKFEDDSNSFSLAVLLTPDKIVGVTNFKPWLRRVQIERPFKSLQFAQLVQGTKNKSNEVSILMFFRHDPKIPNSRDEVMVATINLTWSTTAVADPFAAQISGPDQLHDGLVLPTAVHSHLRVNAEGSFFWVTTPGADRQSSQFRVLRLAQPTMGPQRSSSNFNDLREPDEIRQTDVGHVGGKRPVGGRWEIMTPFQLADRVAGLREEGEKRQTKMEKKKRGDRPTKTEVAATPGGRPLPSLGDSTAEQQLLANFERALDKLAEPGPEQLRRPRIFVVDESLKDKFKWTLYTKLALDQTPFSIQNTKLRFFQANQSLDDVEVSEELQHIRETANDKTRILFMDQAQLHHDGALTTREYGHEPETTDPKEGGEGDETGAVAVDDDDEIDPFPLDHHGARSNMLVLLASGGKAKSLGGLKKLDPRPAPIPLLSIVTPKEWGEIQRDHQHEIQAGVLDDVTLDYNFLTTGWTMWPPTVDKAAEDVKALAKRPFRSEEMRVFPTLEQILNQAAAGELKGKKTIILVPDELKTLVQNLVLIRWSTRDAAAGDWNYRNPKLALARIGTNHMKFQREVIDNFRALRGAANSRNSVLYADLDTIAKMRRPDQDAFGKQSSIFRLRNPVQKTGNSLFGEFEVRKPGEVDAPEAEAEAEADPHERMGDLLDPEEFDHDDELNALDEDNLTPDLIRAQISNNNETISRLRDSVEDMDRHEEPRDSSLYRQTLELLADRKMFRERLLEVQQRVDEAYQELEPEQKEMAAVSPDPAPHIMYWIASEGEMVQPRPDAGWSVGRTIDPKIATILIGTPDELETIQTNLTHEAKYFDLRKEFDVISLEAPSDETKFKLVSQLFDRPDVQSLHLNFKLDRDNGRNPRSQLIHKFVNRVDQLAQNPERPIEKTTAFIRAYVALQHALIEDLDLFSHREVSEKFIERLFTKVFPMPLNREILEPYDPLNRLADQDQAVRDLQAAGVEGSPKLKHRIFNTVLSQTRPTDTSRPIPNSQILFGGTSVGKTFFLLRMFHMFNFTAYQPQKNNEDADYIYIDVSKLTADDTSTAADSMPVKEAIENIIDFLAQPKGTRAHIVFDDAHDAKNKEVREKIFGFIRSLFQAPGGMYQVKSKTNPGKQFDIPVQNLNLYMTVNPTSNERQRREFIKEKLTPNELLKREVLAAISGEGYNIEESFLARWGDIIDMDKFPRSAKVPELVRRVRAYQVPNGHMVMVDPEVIFRLIDTYPEAHARELLSPATSALTAKPPDVEEGPIYLVSNDRRNRLERDATKPGSVSQEDLAKAVRRSTRVDTIKPEDPIGLVNFMGFVMHNFRLQIFNGMVLEASQKDQLQLSRPRLKDLLRTNFLLGMSTHVLDNDRLPVGELVVRPDLFGFYTRGQREELMRYHQQLREDGRKNYFPIELDVRDRRASDSLDAFLSGQGVGLAERRTRKDVLGATVDKVEAVLLKAMAIYLRVHTPEQLLGVGHWKTEEITRWFMELPDLEPVERFSELRAELVALFNDFEQRLNGPDFEDNRELELYSQVRLFAYVVDKALTRLPWGQITNFVINVAAASADTSLGPRPSFRNYLSIHQLSAFSIGTPEFMNDMFDAALNDNAYRRSAEELQQLKSNFFEACQDLLRPAGVR